MEKQISVDPVSLTLAESASNMHNLLPPLAARTRSRCTISCSLPNSSLSSPVATKPMKKGENQFEMCHSVALSNLERLRRSKSCGEGRASQPSLDFDHIWSTSTHIMDGQVPHVRLEDKAEKIITSAEEDEPSSYRDKFRCGACLFLPGFSKGRTVKGNKELRKVQSGTGGSAYMTSLDEFERGIVGHVDLGKLSSQRVSLEKFECGSWRSHGEDPKSNLFYDLPVELIRCVSFNDTESPVTEGFVFDNKDRHYQRHGGSHRAASATWNRGGFSQTCHSSSHERFSTPSPPILPTLSCIAPRLRKARDDFNALLEAQNA